MPESDRPALASLDPLLKPRSVAVIGASDDPTRVGGRPLHYLKSAGFAGPIYPVNPKRAKVQGLKSYGSPDELPGPVDVAIVVLPAQLVPEALEACAAKGVGGAIVFSAGFAEAGAEGAALQTRLRDIARAGGLRLLGPNCLGVYNPALGFYATFSATFEEGFPSAGPVGLVSQSGAYGSHLSLLARRRGVRLGYWITTGNEGDVELAEAMAWLAEEPEVRVIVAYAEGIRAPERLLEALELARAKRKPVIFMKVGTSEVGAAAVRSHTAALAGADRVYDAVLKQFGAYRARDGEEMLDVAYAAAAGVFPEDRGLGLMTISGGVGVMMADAAERLGLEVPALPAPAQDRLKAKLPFATTRNPVDFTGHVYNDKSLFPASLEALLGDGGHGAVIAFLTFAASAAGMFETVLEAFAAARRDFPGRVLINCMVGPPEVIARYEAAGCLVFEDPSRAVRAVAALHWFARAFEKPARCEAVRQRPTSPLPVGPIGEWQAKQLLSAAGISVVREQLVTSADEAIAAGRALGWPVAAKLASPDIAHKTEVGGVLLGVNDEEALRDAYEILMERARASAPEAPVEGVLVSPMVVGGIETILGVQRDPVFGPVVICGLGGVLAEVLEDVSLRLAPIDEAEAGAMIEELRGYPLLCGFRGAPAADLAVLARAIAVLSCFAAALADRIESVDVNPFLVLPEGQGGLALDALIVPRGEAAG